MSYSVIVPKRVLKEMKGIPNVYTKKIYAELKSLEIDPFPNGSKKLQGSENKYRIRVGTYRIIYSVFENELLIEIIKIYFIKFIIF